MKVCRVKVANETFYAILEGETLHRLNGDVFESMQKSGETYPLSEASLLAPTLPSKIVCIGKNYYDHALECGGSLPPEEPLMFIKPSTSVNDPEGEITYPPDSKRLDYEAELAIVIGKRCKDACAEDYQDYIFGYTCMNDVTARDIQSLDGQWTRSKGYDTFCPLGPWIETELDADNVNIQSRLNGELRQNASTSLLMHPIQKLICYISRVMTLLPGDVIATGTPAGIGPMQKGDIIEVEIEGIGILRNSVKK